MVMRMAAESSFTLSISLLLLLEIHINTDELLLLTLQCFQTLLIFKSGFILTSGRSLKKLLKQ